MAGMQPPALPAVLDGVLRPVWSALPPERAMPTLVGPGIAAAEVVERVGQCVRDPALAGRLELHAGLWLYVDQLDRSHAVSQGIDDATGAFWHGIMHRREGDFANSHYWIRRAGDHPAMKSIDGYDPHAFVDGVQAASMKAPPADLLDLQRREWMALFAWCAAVGR